ncbi:MAG: metallophosphoesterase [Anaerolineae bacterium]|nr:metallophosphoesterase [Anaerolineae bacterium]
MQQKTSQTGQYSRRRFLKLAAGGISGLSLAGLGGATYTTRVEPYRISVTRTRVPLPHLPPAFEGFTIAQISDLHMGEWITQEQLATMVRLVNALEPDFVALTGDIASRRYPGLQAEITAVIDALRAREGVAATLGNHDHWLHAPTIRQAVLESQAALLWNTHVALEREGERLYILGVDDVWEREADLVEALDAIPLAPVPTVLLAHEPDYADYVAESRRIGLQLSGHSHGGQVRLPGIGAPVLPRLGEKYDQGLYRVGEMHLYVNRGIGMTAPHVRFNCPPEITLITLTRPGTA